MNDAHVYEMQVQMWKPNTRGVTIEDLTGKLAMATENWNALWKSFRSLAGLLRTSADDGQSWDQFIPQVLTHFQEFVKRCAQLCTRNVLA